jgi:hypothetical protein
MPQNDKEQSNVLPFPTRFAEPVPEPERPTQPEIFDDSTTVVTCGPYEDPESDEY